MRRYRVAGLDVDSEFAFPDVASHEADARPAEVRIEFITGPEPQGDWTAYFTVPIGDRQDLRFQPRPGLGFRILNGNRIEILRQDHITDTDVYAFLIGSAWGMLCHQRGLLPLHCSAIYQDGRAVAFTGVSGAGKSTLAAGLAERGYSHFCDDVMVVDFTEQGPRMAAMPKGLKLCEDAIGHFGITPGRQVVFTEEVRKFYVSVESDGPDEQVELSALYVLAYHEDGSPPRIERITGRDYWSELYQSVYRIEFVPWINSPLVISKQLTELTAAVDIFRFTRPRGFDRYQEGLDVLAQHVASLGGPPLKTAAG